MLKIVSVLLVASCGLKIATSSKCDRTPEGSSAAKSPPDGRYRLRVANDPIRYLPGETYNISLEGISRFNQITPHKFTGFFITVEKDYPGLRGSEEEAVGRFHIAMHSMSKFSGKCQNLVTHTSSFPKSDIMVFWTAPSPGSGCVLFKSTVIEHRDVWYSDDGALSLMLCEDESDSGDTQPLVLDECTACDEAKYELTFEGLWSRHTHPKDFPDNGWLTKFSDVIGASHTKEFRFWTYGEPASDGLKELAEYGSTRQLERELKEEGEHIRTIIKARGISYPNVTGKTFAVFRVDSKHHLVSLVSMIYPSPDWFVGVSGLELCLSNGSWAEEKILNLYPYDAGTDSGPSYISSDQPTIPKEAIRRIKPNQPNDPRSPFHDPDNKEMKPLARLYLTRQRLYEKICENKESEQSLDPDQDQDCSTTRWSEWSDCDSSCGRGKKTREREYKNPEAAYGCKKKMIDYEDCHGTNDNCNDDDAPADSDNQMVDQTDECAVTEWSEFSECSKDCGKGERTRTREYVSKSVSTIRKCKKISSIDLEEKEACEGQKCSGDLEITKTKIKKYCPTIRWSPFSPCTAKCGLGERIKVRIPKENQKQDQNLDKIRKLYRKLTSKNGRNDNDENEDDEDDEEDENGNMLNKYDDIMEINDSDHQCSETQLITREVCGEKNLPCEELYGRPGFCLQKPFRHKCMDEIIENRWFFKKETSSCGIYTYTGCEGQNNSFLTEADCMDVCSKRESKALRSFNLISHGTFPEKIDCKVTHWKHEPCNATCGEGFKWKHRSVIQRPQNGGLPCPRTLVHFERCYKDCGGEKISGHVANSHHHHQCRYSEWSPWTPCSKTCGDFAVQIRTRTVLNHLNTHLCNERLEERRCDVMPCLVGGGYNSYNYNYRS